MQPNTNYLTMGNYGMSQPYQPMAPFAMTQPQQQQPPNWWMQPTPRAFPVATANGPVAMPVDPNNAWGSSWDATDAAGVVNTMPNGQQRSIMDSFLQQRNTDGTTSGGWGSAALGVAQGLGGLYLGMQQYNLAKEALANSKDQFNRQFAVQKNLTNSQLEDRQRARVASNAGAYQSVGEYMSQNGVK
jgi:hypothetical protein